MDPVSLAEFTCDRCGFGGTVENPFAGCPACRHLSTLRLNFEPDPVRLRMVMKSGGGRNALASLQPFHHSDWLGLGEGATGLVRSQRVGPALGLDALFYKNESTNPNGSFKDRYVSMTTNVAKLRSFRGVVVSSTGNLGLSTAAYAAAAGFSCVLILGDDAPPSFIRDGRRFGAFVISAKRSIRFQIFSPWRAEKIGFRWAYLCLGQSRDPFGIEGYRNIAYEILLDLGHAPDVVIFPAARGNNIFGTYLGFQKSVRCRSRQRHAEIGRGPAYWCQHHRAFHRNRSCQIRCPRADSINCDIGS